jgi:hypothetical protein
MMTLLQMQVPVDTFSQVARQGKAFSMKVKQEFEFDYLHLYDLRIA